MCSMGNIIYFKVRLSALKGVLNIDFVDGLDCSDVTLFVWMWNFLETQILASFLLDRILWIYRSIGKDSDWSDTDLQGDNLRISKSCDLQGVKKEIGQKMEKNKVAWNCLKLNITNHLFAPKIRPRPYKVEIQLCRRIPDMGVYQENFDR